MKFLSRGGMLLYKFYSRQWGVAILAAAVFLANCCDTGSGQTPPPHPALQIFSERCISCHNQRDRAGGLSLINQADAETGGQSGTVIEPGDPDASYLIDLITPEDGQAAMPQNSEPLDAKQIRILRDWIRKGAEWPAGVELPGPRMSGGDWWSMKPLVRPAMPQLDPATELQIGEHPIDRFVAHRLAAHGLRLAPQASKEVLIRRLYFDLIGLPPTPQEIERFAADQRLDAWEHLVDQLLASPHYGERWARHWLDVAHYADSHGFDKDKPRENAWPYRDYVIRSFNSDKPWGRFVREQVAGDVLYPGTAEGVEALGFLAAGPWDFVGHEEVPESKIDGMLARHLDRDDMVRTTFQSFMSLTVGCAQCHNHKFDPIQQKEYYQLQSFFAALDRADTSYYRDEEVAKQFNVLKQRRADAAEQQVRVENEVARRLAEDRPELVEQWERLQPGADLNRSPHFGYHSGIESSDDVVKWLQIDLGEPRTIASVELVPAYDTFNQVGAGFGFPRKLRVEASVDSEFADDVRVLWSGVSNDLQGQGKVPVKFAFDPCSARFVRVVAEQLAPRGAADYSFAMAEIAIFDTEANNLARYGSVTSLDSIEAPPRWQRTNLIDGIVPIPFRNDAERGAALEQLYRDLLSSGEHDAWVALRKVLAELDAQLAQLPPADRAYVATVHHGSGNFLGRGAMRGRPRPIYVLDRGDVTKPGDEVQPGCLSLVVGLPATIPAAEQLEEGHRRVALANWLSAPENHFTWRSIVNRVWQHHFGTGIVATPDDFGLMGQQPSHPELLNWLAVEFRDGGQSLKSLHRLIVTSRTYRQSSIRQPSDEDISQAMEIDPDNRLLWRFQPRKLDAEAIRDSMLMVAGQLDVTMGGPGYRDFVIERPEHSPHYRYDLADPRDPSTLRRSIYRFIVRSQLQPLMTSLDCADPSQQVGARTQSNSPLQALALLNNALVLAMSEAFAERLQRDEPDLESQIRAAFYRVTGRPPGEAEMAVLTEHAAAEGLASTCRLLFNLNEFIYVD